MVENRGLKNSFKIDLEIIPNNNYKLSENLYNGLEKRIVENFICLICLKVVKNSVKCEQCCKFYCGKCIENYISKKKNCPNCLCSPFKIGQMDLLMMNILNNSEFICPLGCGKIFRYCDQDLHKKECQFIERFYKCSLCKIDIGEENEITHRQKCANLKIKSLCCNQILNKFDYENHLDICQEHMKFCDKLNIYYANKYEDAFKNGFKEILTEYDSFYQKIKHIGKLF